MQNRKHNGRQWMSPFCSENYIVSSNVSINGKLSMHCSIETSTKCLIIGAFSVKYLAKRTMGIFVLTIDRLDALISLLKIHENNSVYCIYWLMGYGRLNKCKKYMGSLRLLWWEYFILVNWLLLIFFVVLIDNL